MSAGVLDVTPTPEEAAFQKALDEYNQGDWYPAELYTLRADVLHATNINRDATKNWNSDSFWKNFRTVTEVESVEECFFFAWCALKFDLSDEKRPEATRMLFWLATRGGGVLLSHLPSAAPDGTRDIQWAALLTELEAYDIQTILVNSLRTMRNNTLLNTSNNGDLLQKEVAGARSFLERTVISPPRHYILALQTEAPPLQKEAPPLLKEERAPETNPDVTALFNAPPKLHEVSQNGRAVDENEPWNNVGKGGVYGIALGMLAGSDEDRVFVQRKYDGWRCVIEKNGSAVTVRSKSGGVNMDTKYTELLAESLKTLPNGVVDCEAVVLDGEERDVFNKASSVWRKYPTDGGPRLTFVAFDFYAHDGTTQDTYAKRLEILRSALPNAAGALIRHVPTLLELTARSLPWELYDVAKEQILTYHAEGLVLRRALALRPLPSVKNSRMSADDGVKVRPDHMGPVYNVQITKEIPVPVERKGVRAYKAALKDGKELGGCVETYYAQTRLVPGQIVAISVDYRLNGGRTLRFGRTYTSCSAASTPDAADNIVETGAHRALRLLFWPAFFVQSPLRGIELPQLPDGPLALVPFPSGATDDAVATAPRVSGDIVHLSERPQGGQRRVIFYLAAEGEGATSAKCAEQEVDFLCDRARLVELLGGKKKQLKRSDSQRSFEEVDPKVLRRENEEGDRRAWGDLFVQLRLL